GRFTTQTFRQQNYLRRAGEPGEPVSRGRLFRDGVPASLGRSGKNSGIEKLVHQVHHRDLTIGPRKACFGEPEVHHRFTTRSEVHHVQGDIAMLVQAGKYSCDFTPWRPAWGKVFSPEKPFAFDVETPKIVGHEIPEHVMGAASDGEIGVFVTP